MRYRVTFAVGFAAGFVVGARAGRERYEQIRKTARRAMDNPAVQQAAGALRGQAGGPCTDGAAEGRRQDPRACVAPRKAMARATSLPPGRRICRPRGTEACARTAGSQDRGCDIAASDSPPNGSSIMIRALAAAQATPGSMIAVTSRRYFAENLAAIMEQQCDAARDPHPRSPAAGSGPPTSARPRGRRGAAGKLPRSWSQGPPASRPYADRNPPWKLARDGSQRKGAVLIPPGQSSRPGKPYSRYWPYRLHDTMCRAPMHQVTSRDEPSVEVLPEHLRAAGVAQLGQRLRLDLPDALPRHAELLADLLKRPRVPVSQAEP